MKGIFYFWQSFLKKKEDFKVKWGSFKKKRENVLKNESEDLFLVDFLEKKEGFI